MKYLQSQFEYCEDDFIVVNGVEYFNCDHAQKIFERLQEAEEVIKFYADKKNWTAVADDYSYGGIVDEDIDPGYENAFGGIKAREYLKKVGIA